MALQPGQPEHQLEQDEHGGEDDLLPHEGVHREQQGDEGKVSNPFSSSMTPVTCTINVLQS
jgi:hypothetical protein